MKIVFLSHLRFRGEPISWMGILGAVLITIGVILAQKK